MIYLYISVVIVIISFIISIVMIRRQQNHERDNSMSATAYKHRIVGNPGLIAHVIFIVIGIVLIGFFSFYHSK